MKRILLFIIASVLAFAANALQETPVASTQRTSTATSADLYARKTDVGIIVTTNITAITGTQTITPIIEGKDARGNYYTLLSGTAGSATGVITMYVRPGITAAANAAAALPLPPVFRVRALHSGSAITATYSISVDRTN